jgi:alpha-beta hydrolase superfamily lysophospholipase
VLSVALWGRSMGAVASLRCAARWATLAPQERQRLYGSVPLTGLILDSPFSRLWTLAQHIVGTSRMRPCAPLKK